MRRSPMRCSTNCTNHSCPRAEEVADVRVKYPAHLPLRDRHIDCVQGIVLAAPRPKPMAEAHEILLVDRLEDPHQRRLDDLVLQRRNAQRTSPTIGLGSPCPFARFRPKASAVYPIMEISEALFPPLAVLQPRHVVYSGCGIAPLRLEGLTQELLAHVVQQIGEPLLWVPSRCLSYPGQTARRWFLPLCTGHGRLPRIPLGRVPFLHGLRRWLAVYHWLSTFVRPPHRYYSPVRLPSCVRVGIEVNDLSRPDRRWDAAGHSWDLPVSVHGTCVHAMVLRLRGSDASLALSRRTVWPSLSGNEVGNPNSVISELNSPACTPPVNASPPPSRRADA